MGTQVVDALQYLLAGDKTRGATTPPTALDAFSALLADRLCYLPGERDMVAMHHEFDIVDPRNGRKVINDRGIFFFYFY